MLQARVQHIRLFSLITTEITIKKICTEIFIFCHVLCLSYNKILYTWKGKESFVPALSLKCLAWAFLSQGSRIHSADPISNKAFDLFYILFWLCTVCSASCCFPLFVTYCHCGDLSFFSPSFPEVSHRPKKWGGMKTETELALTVSSSTYFVFIGEIFITLSKTSTYF